MIFQSRPAVKLTAPAAEIQQQCKILCTNYFLRRSSRYKCFNFVCSSFALKTGSLLQRKPSVFVPSQRLALMAQPFFKILSEALIFLGASRSNCPMGPTSFCNFWMTGRERRRLTKSSERKLRRAKRSERANLIESKVHLQLILFQNSILGGRNGI